MSIAEFGIAFRQFRAMPRMREVAAQDLERGKFDIGSEIRQHLPESCFVCIGKYKGRTEPVLTLDGANRHYAN
jgi:hypothetical protein